MVFDRFARLLGRIPQQAAETPNDIQNMEPPEPSFGDPEIYSLDDNDTELNSRDISPSSAIYRPYPVVSYVPTVESGPVPETTLQKLKDWIDNPPPFDQKTNTSPVYLFKSEFTFAVLMEGLIYIVGKYKSLCSEFRTLVMMAAVQHRQDLGGWLEEYGLDLEPERICLRLEIESVGWEIELRSAMLTDDEKKLLPRTMVAIARLVKKLESSNYDLKYGVAALQGDLDVEGLFEEDQEGQEDGEEDEEYE